jgi:DNA primase
VAFGGRAMPAVGNGVPEGGKEPPKYINSREIEIYKKGQVLYGLDAALPEIRRTKAVYLAEGYMDVIALHQAGVTNAVAPCGTAFTDEQAKLLRNWADTAILLFDSDDAGQQAAAKGIITCRKNGLGCSLVVPEAAFASDAKDPADILQKFGADALKKTMNRATIDFEYLVAKAKTRYNIAIPKEKTVALALLYPYFSVLDSKTERNACIEAAADEMRTAKDAVEKDFEQWLRSGKGGALASGQGRPDSEEVSGTERPIRMNDELFLLTVVSINMGLYPEFRALIEIKEIEDPAAKELCVALEECFINEENGTDALLARIYSERLRNFIAERGISPEFRGDSVRKLMEDGIRRIKGRRLRRRLSEIGAELRLQERNSGMAGSDFQDLIAEKMQLDAEIRRLEGN